MPRNKKPATKGKRLEKRAQKVSELQQLQALRERSEALAMARSIALAGLPRRPTEERVLRRTFRIGLSAWTRITYQADDGHQLPYGADRMVLAAVQHLAIRQQAPVISFGRAGEILTMFRLDVNGHQLELLRQRFHRLSGLLISVSVASTREGLDVPHDADRELVIKRYRIPTRNELRREALEDLGQLRLDFDSVESSAVTSPTFGVRLSRDFFAFLQASENMLLVPLDLLRLFTDRPVGWDYACFLVARCGAARSESIVDHDTLIEMFAEGQEPARNTFARLERYQREIMQATAGKLNARLEETRAAKSTGGRPAKRWCLRVGPSESLLGQSATAPILIENGSKD